MYDLDQKCFSHDTYYTYYLLSFLPEIFTNRINDTPVHENKSIRVKNVLPERLPKCKPGLKGLGDILFYDKFKPRSYYTRVFEICIFSANSPA